MIFFIVWVDREKHLLNALIKQHNPNGDWLLVALATNDFAVIVVVVVVCGGRYSVR